MNLITDKAAAQTIELAFCPGAGAADNSCSPGGGPGAGAASTAGAGKLSIQTAAKALSEKGYHMGAAVPWKPGDKETSYHVKGPDGKQTTMTAKEISGLAHGAHSNMSAGTELALHQLGAAVLRKK